MYAAIKHIHFTCVVLSLLGFIVRGLWMLGGSNMLQERWVRVVPHVVDTLLLASAIALAVMIGQYPFVHGWLTAKVLGLVAYIGLGTVALKRGRTRRIRLTAWLAALAVFGYIVSVALTHDPRGVFTSLF